MKRSVLLQLTVIAVVTASALAFVKKSQPHLIHCVKPCPKTKCCEKEENKSLPDNTFFNPMNRMVAVVYR